MMAGPLDGVKVLDLSVMISGPLAAMMLADQGAEVIKVETPGIGDLMRYLGSNRNGMSALFTNCNRGKQCITIDMKNPAGLDTFRELVKSADVVIQNFRPGAADRLSIGFEDLKAINENLIYVSISGFGQSGPYSGRRVYDNIIQAYAGFASVQTNPADGKPQVLRNLVCDKVTSYTAAQAITAALFARATGKAKGQHIELAMLDAGIAFLWPDGAMDAALLAEDANRQPTIGSFYSVTEMKDGYTTGSVISDAEWQAFSKAVGKPELATDERFASLGARMMNARDLGPMIRDACAAIAVDDYIAAADEYGAPAAPIRSIADLPSDPQVTHNDVFAVVDHPVAGPLREPRPAPQFSSTPAHRAAPVGPIGSDTDAVLAANGFSAERIAELRAAGALG
jgi:crotonobetainyl-CoA:carnitine CoA-transferase CaiB-like acyl-CoA transferase